MGRGRLAAALAACAVLAAAATATAARAPAIYSVAVSGTIETSAFVPRHQVEGCDRDGGVYVRTFAFRSRRAASLVVRGDSLKTTVPVDASVDFGGTSDHRIECADGRTSTVHVDWTAPRRYRGLPLTLGFWGGQVWLDGAPDDIAGVCFGADSPTNPLPLANVYGLLSLRSLARRRPAVVEVRREETERANSDSCALVRSIHWRVSLRRIG